MNDIHVLNKNFHRRTLFGELSLGSSHLSERFRSSSCQVDLPPNHSTGHRYLSRFAHVPIRKDSFPKETLDLWQRRRSDDWKWKIERWILLSGSEMSNKCELGRSFRTHTSWERSPIIGDQSFRWEESAISKSRIRIFDFKRFTSAY